MNIRIHKNKKKIKHKISWKNEKEEEEDMKKEEIQRGFKYATPAI